MRTVLVRMPAWLLLAALVACGSESSTPPPAPRANEVVPSNAETPPAPATADLPAPAVRELAAALLRGDADDTRRATAATHAPETVAALLHAAAGGDAQTIGRAPGAIRSLGPAALPGLNAGLCSEVVAERRIAALTLLQWSEELHAQGQASQVLAALSRAREDADPSVRAAAEHAFRRASGDTTEIDASRAADEAALRDR